MVKACAGKTCGFSSTTPLIQTLANVTTMATAVASNGAHYASNGSQLSGPKKSQVFVPVVSAEALKAEVETSHSFTGFQVPTVMQLFINNEESHDFFCHLSENRDHFQHQSTHAHASLCH